MNSHSIRQFLLSGVMVLATVWGSLPVSAQRETWNWYFGNRAGITFRAGDAMPLSDGVLTTSRGCATQSDPITGELLFYTDGVTVWNRLHEPMPNGTGLHGDATTSQSALIVPVPGSPSVFYVFNAAPVSAPNLNGRCLCLTYSIVDLRRENGFGDVVQKNVVVADDITEHLSATAHCTEPAYWIVARSRSSRHFLTFRLTTERLEPTPIKSDASNPQLVVRSGGQMQIAPNGHKLIITSVSGNSQLYDFSPSTGKVTNGVNLFPDDPLGMHYGAAFSADNKYVYIAVNGRSRIANEIFRFRTDMPSALQTVTSRQFIRGGLGLVPTLIPMQTGPDSAIYLGRPGETILSAIYRPSQVELDSIRFVDTAVVLTGRCQSGLPAIIGSLLFPTNGVSTCDLPQAFFTAPSLCERSCVAYTDRSTGRIDAWQWLFEGAEPSSSTNRNPPRICYSVAGQYRVRLIVTNENGSDTADRTVTVSPLPRLRLSSEVAACRGTAVRLSVSGAASYRWFPTATMDDSTSATPVVRPSNTTKYTVIGTSADGCVDTATVLVRIPIMEAGPDMAICKGDAVRLRASGATSYRWTPEADLDDPRSASPLARPTTTTAYVVTMTTDTCVITDTVVVSVVDSVAVTISAPTAICSGDTVDVEAVGSTASSYQWRPALAVADAAARRTRLVITERTVLHVTAQSGSCSAVDSMVIDVLPRPALTAIGNTTICPGDRAPLRAITQAATVRWSPAAHLDDAASRTPLASPDSTTTYVVEAYNDEGCVSRDSVTVIVLDMVKVSAGNDKSMCRGDAVQLSGVGPSGATYRWSPVLGLDDPTKLSPIASPSVTTTYVLTIDAGLCIVSDSMTVFVSSLDITATADTAICMGATVRLLAEGGASRFTWTPQEGLSDATIANPIASPRVTTTYLVRAEDQYGCRDEETITVFVRDTIPIRLRIGSGSADAGSDDVRVPIYVEADPALLPIQIDELRAEINCDLTVFKPVAAERGDVVIGRTSDARRVTILTMRNVQVLSPSQRLTTLSGQVLLGSNIFTAITWGSVDWQGEFCPTVSTQSGTLYVSGCYIQGRLIKYFGEAGFRLLQRPQEATVDIIITGSEPGLHVARIINVEGQIVWQGSVHRASGDVRELTLTADVSTLGSGSYFVQLIEPFGSSTAGMTLVR